MTLTGYDRHGKRAWIMKRPEDLLVNAKTFELPDWWTWERPGTTVRIRVDFDDNTWTEYTHPAGGKA